MRNLKKRDFWRGKAYAVLLTYLLFCVAIYFLQGYLLFPAYAAPPVPDDWQPSVGASHRQALLDGRCGKLHAVLWQAADSKGTVMVFHGNGESVASVELEVPMFQQLGYSVMAWDYPGYGRSASCWFSEDDLLQDADAAYQWLVQQQAALPVVLYGRSVGAGIAIHVAKDHPGHRLLLVSPYDSLANVARQSMPFFVPVSLMIRYPLHADRWISEVKGPVHAIHGLADNLILPERAQALVRAAKGKVDMEWIKGAGHNDITLFGESRGWLEQSLAAGILPAI